MAVFCEKNGGEVKDLTYIEEYIKGEKYNMPEFSVSWIVKSSIEINYWARFGASYRRQFRRSRK